MDFYNRDNFVMAVIESDENVHAAVPCRKLNVDEGIDDERDEYLHEPRAEESLVLPEKETWPIRLGFSRRSDE